MNNYLPFNEKQEIWNHWYRTSHFIVEVVEVKDLQRLPDIEGWGPRYIYKEITIHLSDSYEYDHIYFTNSYRHSKLRNCTIMTHQEFLDDCLKAENHLQWKYNWYTLKPHIPSFYLRERFIPQPDWTLPSEKLKRY